MPDGKRRGMDTVSHYFVMSVATALGVLLALWIAMFLFSGGPALPLTATESEC